MKPISHTTTHTPHEHWHGHRLRLWYRHWHGYKHGLWWRLWCILLLWWITHWIYVIFINVVDVDTTWTIIVVVAIVIVVVVVEAALS